MASKSHATSSLWLAQNPSKRWTELFFLMYSPFWIFWALCIVVPFQLYEYCGSWGYMAIGTFAAAPCFLLPLVIPCKVPICLYLMTHAYFCFYHALSNVLLRRYPNAVRYFFMGAMVFVLAYSTAYGETLTIANFRHYTFIDKDRMYSVGSLFYAIYFFVSFPMFFRMDEEVKRGAPRWTVTQAAIDSLAASMLVTILLDLWRISIGSILNIEVDGGLPFMG
eukprot:gene15523-21611_t